MKLPPQLRTFLTIIQIGAYLLLLTNLFRSGLFGKYRYFGWYITLELTRLSVMSLLPLQTQIYAHVYFATQPIVWLFYVLVVLELFQLVLRNHAGIASLGRRALTWSLAGSALVSGLTLLVDLQTGSSEHALLYNFMLLERLVMTSLLLLLLCLTVFLGIFPVPLTRNIRVHTAVFAVYFAVRTSLLWIRTIYGVEQAQILNLAGATLAIGCLLAWTTLLGSSGETVPVRVKLKSEAEERLLAQLDAINETLLRSARK